MTVRSGDTDAVMELWWVDPPDWRRLLRDAGFDAIESYGWFDRRRLRPGSSDSVWIASRSGSGLRIIGGRGSRWKSKS